MRRAAAVAVAVAAACAGGCGAHAGSDAGGADAGGTDAMPGTDAGAGGTWSARAPLAGGPRQETGVGALGGLVYVVGGFDETATIVADVERYDPATDTWEAVAPVPEPMHHANVAAAAGRLWVAGYLTGLGFVANGNVYGYDPVADAWTPAATMPAGTERGAGGCAAEGDVLYVAGGWRGGSVDDVSAYDAVADAWTALAPLPGGGRDHLVAGATGGLLYAIGGRSDAVTAVTGRVDVLDPAAGTWTSGAPMPTPRGGSAAGLVNGLVVVAGGEGNTAAASGVFDAVEAYDPAADAWSVHAPMLTPRHGTGAAGVGNTLYVPGGADVMAFGAVATVEALAF
jgi:N-acetylneuraminic acid mutarotase